MISLNSPAAAAFCRLDVSVLLLFHSQEQFISALSLGAERLILFTALLPAAANHSPDLSDTSYSSNRPTNLTSTPLPPSPTSNQYLVSLLKVFPGSDAQIRRGY
ncbi:unnamed protein product [Caenorhabditis auriculariae]|uniref:Uncharacterized protein n=1 Tax=Caenorhabditis auriculariae TaxID=2777116 RepID=A0A8S1H6R8_9PELO|nr:unnamed protein product [Caenorhabditis auriculariae]